MPRLEGSDILLVPSAEAVRLSRQVLDTGGRINRKQAFGDGELHQRPHGLEPISGGEPGHNLLGEHRVDMLALQQPGSLVTMLRAKAFQNIAAGPPRLRGERPK